MLVALVVFWAGGALGRGPAVDLVKHNELLGPFMARYLAWLLGPLERALVGRVSPNTITALSLSCFAVGGVATAIGRLGIAVLLFTLGGVLDVLDGRLARRSKRQSRSGALFDSVADRWADLLMFSGFAWLLRDTPWLLATIAAMGSSLMVSYTRARAEGLGIDLSGGMMQRAERLVLITAGTFVAGWSGDSVLVLGGVMSLCASLSFATAIRRFVVACRALDHADDLPGRWSRSISSTDRDPERASLTQKSRTCSTVLLSHSPLTVSSTSAQR